MPKIARPVSLPRWIVVSLWVVLLAAVLQGAFEGVAAGKLSPLGFTPTLAPPTNTPVPMLVPPTDTPVPTTAPPTRTPTAPATATATREQPTATSTLRPTTATPTVMKPSPTQTREHKTSEPTPLPATGTPAPTAQPMSEPSRPAMPATGASWGIALGGLGGDGCPGDGASGPCRGAHPGSASWP